MHEAFHRFVKQYTTQAVYISMVVKLFGAECVTFAHRTSLGPTDSTSYLTALVRFETYYFNFLFFNKDEDFTNAFTRLCACEFRGMQLRYVGPQKLDAETLELTAYQRESVLDTTVPAWLGVFRFDAKKPPTVADFPYTFGSADPALQHRLTEYICGIVRGYPAAPSDPFIVQAHFDQVNEYCDQIEDHIGYLSVQVNFESQYLLCVLVHAGMDNPLFQLAFDCTNASDVSLFKTYKRLPTFPDAVAAAQRARNAALRVFVLNIEEPFNARVLRSAFKGIGDETMFSMESAFNMGPQLERIQDWARMGGLNVRSFTAGSTGFATVKFPENACVVFQRGRFDPSWRLEGFGSSLEFYDDGALPGYAVVRPQVVDPFMPSAVDPYVLAALQALRKLTPAQRNTLQIVEAYVACTTECA